MPSSSRIDRRLVVVAEVGEVGLDAGGDRDRRGAGGGRVVGDDARHRVLALVDVGDEQHGLAGQRREVAQRVGRVWGTGTVRAGLPACSASMIWRSQASSATAALSPERASRMTFACRRSAVSRSASSSSVSIVSMSRAGSTEPSGWMTLSSVWVRTTCRSASHSRMLARNLLPRPSPLDAPATRPAMSWNSIVSQTMLEALIDRGHLLHPLVLDRHDGDVGLDRRERVVRRLGAGLAERVEQRGLARVGHPHEPDLHHRPRLPISVPSAAPAATSDG